VHNPGNSAYAPGYVQKLPAYDAGETGNALYYFDDLVSYRERWQMQTAWDMAGGCGYIYVVDNGGNRVEVFNSNGTYLSQIGCATGACSAGSGNGKFNGPQGVSVDKSGNIWVADWNNGRIEEFSSSGTYLTQGSGPGGGAPAALAFDASGNVWLANYGPCQVQMFTSSATYVSEFGGCGYAQGEFHSLNGIAVDSSGNIWTADEYENRVQKFNSSGTYLMTIPTSGCTNAGQPSCPAGTGNGEFQQPNSLAVDGSGNLWAADYFNYRAQEFNSSGTYLFQFGTQGTGHGQFEWVNFVAIDPSGNVWVTDATNNNVQEFTSSGVFLQSFGSSGTGNGQFNEAAGIAIGTR
jgi:streptogramin lyase